MNDPNLPQESRLKGAKHVLRRRNPRFKRVLRRIDLVLILLRL